MLNTAAGSVAPPTSRKSSSTSSDDTPNRAGECDTTTEMSGTNSASNLQCGQAQAFAILEGSLTQAQALQTKSAAWLGVSRAMCVDKGVVACASLPHEMRDIRLSIQHNHTSTTSHVVCEDIIQGCKLCCRLAALDDFIERRL